MRQFHPLQPHEAKRSPEDAVEAFAASFLAQLVKDYRDLRSRGAVSGGQLVAINRPGRFLAPYITRPEALRLLHTLHRDRLLTFIFSATGMSITPEQFRKRLFNERLEEITG